MSVQTSSDTTGIEQVLRVLRRRWWIIVPFVLGWAAVLAASWILPPKYKSESLILVEQQRGDSAHGPTRTAPRRWGLPIF